MRKWLSGAFFVSYLGFQVVYPTLPWFLPGYGTFTWHMYAGLDEHPRIFLRFADGSTRAVGSLLNRRAEVRLFGPQVDQERFVPPKLCMLWPDAGEIVLRYPRQGREVVVPCR